jgi:hypothetical protein
MEDGWEFEDNLPESLTDEQYSMMYQVSSVDMVRIFPYVVTPRGREYLGFDSLLAYEDTPGPISKCLFTGTLNTVEVPEGNNGIWMDVTFVYQEILDG